MTSYFGDRHRQERMRQRFRKCGIVVNENAPEDEGGIHIVAHKSLFSCRATIYRQGMVFYVLDLRLISDSPNRVIEAFAIEVDRKAIMVLDRGQRLPSQYVDWDAEEHILNDLIGQRFGPTLCKQGLLLGQGQDSPAQNRNQRWASLTVSIMDQCDNWYEQRLRVAVLDCSPEDQESVVGSRRKSVFEPEDDNPGAMEFEAFTDPRVQPPARQKKGGRETSKEVRRPLICNSVGVPGAGKRTTGIGKMVLGLRTRDASRIRQSVRCRP